MVRLMTIPLPEEPTWFDGEAFYASDPWDREALRGMIDDDAFNATEKLAALKWLALANFTYQK